MHSQHHDGYGQKANEIPAPSHRHAAPSAPWPWIDIQNTVDPIQLASRLPPVPALCDHKSCDGCWKGYPQSRFPNWTKDQVSRSQISKAITNYRRDEPCVVYRADVRSDGFFEDAERMTATEDNKDDVWDQIIHTERPPNTRVRALFIENLSGHVLQMLGTRFNIEPFFFSSSLSWIPSRFQEEVQQQKGDHITVTLTFIKSMPMQPYNRRHQGSQASFGSMSTLASQDGTLPDKQMIDTQAPLRLRSSNRQLVLDLISVHLIRHIDGSTILSFHPDIDHPVTDAKYMHKRIRFAGQSVYWQKIFRESPDPTFLLLTFMWHAMYAWDEAFEDLYAHICQLETSVISTSNTVLTQELHLIRAHQLHFGSLLDDFRKSVEFVRTTRNPAMESLLEEKRELSEQLMDRECDNLLEEIERLDMSRQMQDKRLLNVMNLVFSSINIEDSRRNAQMTEVAVKDSAAMRQIAFVSMVYLPASFVAGVFGMNVREIVPNTTGTLGHYVATALSFTAASVWIILAIQSKHIFGEDITLWQRLGWPLMLVRKFISKKPKEEDPELKLKLIHKD
ncbi:hypothetical protein L208DRAFT_1391284 [Tricholoma matsutake]|nr:hypothetical protein L208DRAFT_1391284 [Tricholoma matsutake 945]